MKVKITEEMRTQASIEAKKRDAFIQHHFNVSHLSYMERDIVGFIGEFACCTLLNIDWKNNIRENYYTIDDYDFKIKGFKTDVKTETIPYRYAQKILNKTIKDDELYGRRLINKGQFSILSKYDLVVFSFFIRDSLDYWYPIGYLETKEIINNYPPTINRPDGGKYPFPGSPVPISILKPIEELL
ncbi:hypothetical protein [Carboxylicivirga sp. M1479]|uniref:hypothetical protein n=1 Tax=Carboxylicivirga sp. M1479 TaxID=2594476 RepID=UPI001177CD07|nr:hypothetical protein [Carboxylicivirga sp. M1479]TRX70723.1 hypothetical protein FNN09_10645 [Carboxylicivirga sp. M1479]